MILVTFALPHESGKFLPVLENKAWLQRGALPLLTGSFEGREITVLHTGVGPEQAAMRVGEFMAKAENPPQCVIAAGYAGGLDERLGAGSLVLADNFSDPALLSLAQEIAGRRAWVGKLTSQSEIAETVEAKERLARETAAIAVDMETSVISEVCARFAVPLLSVRAISDPVGMGMPVPGSVWFDSEAQRPRIVAMLRYLALNPSRIPPFAEFVRGTGAARKELTDFLRGFLGRM